VAVLIESFGSVSFAASKRNDIAQNKPKVSRAKRWAFTAASSKK
jgi:hypothetical protein